MDLIERFRVAAEAEGLVDVAYAGVDSPFGPLTVAMTDKGVVRLAYPDETADDVVDDLARRVSPRVLSSPARLDDVRRQLDEYFSGRRRHFDVAVDWRLTADGFTRRVLQATNRIPYGELLSYRDVAGKAGNERASRATGNALGSNPIPIVVPCHRVVRTGGGLGGYTGGVERKVTLLTIEGAL